MKNRFKKTTLSLALVSLLLLAANGNTGETSKTSRDSAWRHSHKAPKTQLVSVNRAGTDSGNDASDSFGMSANGRFLAFKSSASDLVANDTNGLPDIFVRDLKSGTTTLVTINLLMASSVYDPGFQEDQYFKSLRTEISGNGRFVAFASDAGDLVANKTDSSPGVYVRDLKKAKTTWVGSGFFPQLSDNGRIVAFETYRQIYVRDIKTWKKMLVTVNLAGTESQTNSGDDAPISLPVLSGNGRFVAFSSNASDLVANDTNGGAANLDSGAASDIFVRDLKAAKTTLVTVNRAGMASGYSYMPPGLSADARYVLFSSGANDLVANDTNNSWDVFVRDLKTGKTTLASVNRAGTASANDHSYGGSISADGRYVTLLSSASDLVANDINGSLDVFVRDLKTSKTTLVSVNHNGTASGNGDSRGGQLSADGRIMTFFSAASDLVANDTNGASDAFIRDLKTGETMLMSVNQNGTASGNGDSLLPLSSADGRILVFTSSASNLVANDTNGKADIFVRPTWTVNRNRKHQYIE